MRAHFDILTGQESQEKLRQFVQENIAFYSGIFVNSLVSFSV
jgi:hypothetical protein